MSMCGDQFWVAYLGVFLSVTCIPVKPVSPDVPHIIPVNDAEDERVLRV
jgi:hypothetical protein